MRVSIDCNSPLLQKALDLYLADMIVDESESEFIVSDHLKSSKKPIFLVSHGDDATLKIPFTRDMLLASLEEFSYKHKEKNEEERELELMIEELNRKHKAKIDRLISSYHAKK
jgi:transcriptional regulator